MASNTEGFDRATAIKEFDESRTGVKGLVDYGVAAVPPLFLHPTSANFPSSPPPSSLSIPTVDLSLPRADAVELVRAAASTWGFFQVTNHGIPLETITNAIAAVRRFNELPPDDRARHYTRGLVGGVSYASNVDLYTSSAASWRDTIQIAMGPTRPDETRIPETCRAELLEWDAAATALGKSLFTLLAEGLGVAPGRFEELTCHEGRVMVCHYYPACPEPEKTMGLVTHTDPGALTVLVQDSVGGLEVKWTAEDGEEYWVDVEPIAGAVVINVGDLLQIMSNDGYKSVEHRAKVKSEKEGRVSIAVFMNPGRRGEEDLYGPLPELTVEQGGKRYREFTMGEFMKAFFSKQLSSRSLLQHFMLCSDT